MLNIILFVAALDALLRQRRSESADVEELANGSSAGKQKEEEPKEVVFEKLRYRKNRYYLGDTDASADATHRSTGNIHHEDSEHSERWEEEKERLDSDYISICSFILNIIFSL